jgi:hypothetical protein
MKQVIIEIIVNVRQAGENLVTAAAMPVTPPPPTTYPATGYMVVPNWREKWHGQKGSHRTALLSVLSEYPQGLSMERIVIGLTGRGLKRNGITQMLYQLKRLGMIKRIIMRVPFTSGIHKASS